MSAPAPPDLGETVCPWCGEELAEVDFLGYEGALEAHIAEDPCPPYLAES